MVELVRALGGVKGAQADFSMTDLAQAVVLPGVPRERSEFLLSRVGQAVGGIGNLPGANAQGPVQKFSTR